MKRDNRRTRWWGLAAWTAGAAALASAALASAPTASTLLLVALFAGLMLLLQLRSQAESRRVALDQERTLALLSETLESTADGFLLLDLQGSVVSFNRKLCQMSGLPAESFEDGQLDDLLAWMLLLVENPGPFLARLEELGADTEAEAREEFRLLDGRIFERFTRPHRVGGRIAGRVWSFRDVTAERTALESLHRREQQLAEAQRIARLGSFDWDVAADEVHASAELWRIAGIEPDTRPWSMEQFVECIHPDDRQTLRECVARSLASGEPLACDIRVVHPDGSVHFVASAGHVVFGDSGEPVRIIGTVQDVTERHQTASRLQRRVRTEQAVNEISRLLAGSPIENMDSVLRLLGEALEADRAYLLQSRVDGDRTSVERAQEWCAPGVERVVSTPGGCATMLTPEWLDRIDSQNGMILPEEVETSSDSHFQAPCGRRIDGSLAVVPVRDLRNRLSGLLAVEYPSSAQRPLQEDLGILRTTGEVLATHLARELAEQEIAQRDAILESVGFVSERFLLTGEWQQDLDAALCRIGAAAGASRAYLFANRTAPDGTVFISQRAEWTAGGVAAELDNPALQNVRLADLGLGTWEEVLQRNEAVQGLVSSLPAVAREHLEEQGILSMLLIPIFVGDVWWGFVGFDDCATERRWSHTERDALMTAGRIIGASIQRSDAEAALRDSELRFKQLSDNIPEVFFMMPVDMSEVLYLSASFEKVWGRSNSAALANPMLLIESIVPEDRPLLLNRLDGTRAGRSDPMRHIDFRIIRPNGAIRWIRGRVIQISDHRGRPYRVAGVCADITEQKQFEEDARRASRIEAIGHLAAGIAHEINTPIQYVGDNLRFLDESYSEMRVALGAYRRLLEEARSGMVTPERVAEVASAVEQADLDYLLREGPRASAQALDGVQRVAEIVRAMKEFSHPGSGIKVPTDLNQAVRSTATVARNEWKYVAELVTELDETLAPVMCLPGELNQVLLNLLVNAAHAIADRQRAEGSENIGTITVSTRSCGADVEVCVRDTGTGIPAEARPRIFDPFFTTKEVGRGTGQGLTFVHAIVVEKHGGSISFETETGVGTTFVVRIPKLADDAAIEVAA